MLRPRWKSPLSLAADQVLSGLPPALQKPLQDDDRGVVVVRPGRNLHGQWEEPPPPPGGMVGKVPAPGEKTGAGFARQSHWDARQLDGQLLTNLVATRAVAQNDLGDSVPPRPLAQH